MTQLSRTPLHPLHVERGAKLVDFAGWEMPVQYPAGVMTEHLHTRSAASLFDVSHMAQILIRPHSGDVADAAHALETATPASIAGLEPWRQRYALLTTETGGIGDDIMVANHGEYFYVVSNASRADHDLGVFRAIDGVDVEHVTDRALLALQGPAAETALARLIPAVAELTFMDSVQLDWSGTTAWVSRSGYTGEDGFEVSVPAARAVEFAEALLAMDEVELAGLGARDSLRLEAGMPLYGHDLTTETTPARAGLAWAVPKVRRTGGTREGGFPGADVILPELAAGPANTRMGLRPEGRAPIREGAPVFADETAAEPIGQVTSGGFGPSVGGPVAMATVPAGLAAGTTVYAEVRGKRLPATITPLPFITPSYKR